MKQFLWILLLGISVAIGAFFLSSPNDLYGGDIIEYYGITESLKSHGTPNLTLNDEATLNTVLNPDYLKDPLWYIQGVDGSRYPVHFIFYSILALPVRLMVEAFGGNPLTSLRILNVLLLTATLAWIYRYLIKTVFQRFVLLILVFFSPMVFFLVWPGPDMYYLCMLLLAAFYFGKRRFGMTSFFVILASWHSQPLIILAAGMMLLYLFSESSISRNGWKLHITTSLKTLLVSLAMVDLAFLPYLYNYIVFGVFSPWSIFQDTKTLLYGFGLQNASIPKLLEMVFDLNIGLFWYAPLLIIAGAYCFYKAMQQQFAHAKQTEKATHASTHPWMTKIDAWTRSLEKYLSKSTIVLLIFLVLTMLFYQTNPAWNYGTSGYGPTRHSIFLLPFFIFFIVLYARPSKLANFFVGLFIATQIPILIINGFLAPNFLNSLYHSPYAIAVLNTYPNLYNPTPEIFTDRTNHKDEQFPVSAIYKVDGECKKAYVLLSDVERVKKECGFIPAAYEAKLKDPLLQKTKTYRKVTTSTATFWPDAYTCDYPVKVKDYICMFTIDDVMRFTGVKDKSRFKKLDKYKGVWQLTHGKPVEIIVPPGYFLNYYSFEGHYVNY